MEREWILRNRVDPEAPQDATFQISPLELVEDQDEAPSKIKAMKSYLGLRDTDRMLVLLRQEVDRDLQWEVEICPSPVPSGSIGHLPALSVTIIFSVKGNLNDGGARSSLTNIL